MNKNKLVKVHCAECKQPFHVPLSLADESAEGTGEVTVECMHCRKKVMIKIPRAYIPEGEGTYKNDNDR